MRRDFFCLKTMNPDLHREIIPLIEAGFGFDRKKAVNGFLRGGKCPKCGKKELYTYYDKPWTLRCGRLNKCGEIIYIKEEYPHLFENWGTRYQQTEADPHAAADAYLRSARGFDLERIKGLYTQETYYDYGKKISSATVRFPIANGGYWERIIDQPSRFGPKKAHFNKGCNYQGTIWSPPIPMPEDEIWFVEGIFDSISMMLRGIWAGSPLSCSNYPSLFLQAIREQCEANDKPLPALVFAYDDGKAGTDFMQRHVERATADGWKASAAYIRNFRGIKRDWNDLHIADQLTPEAIEEARYRGALLTARSASDKAGIMFKRKAWNQFFFDFDNRLFWFEIDFAKLNEAKKAIRDIAGNESKTDQEIHDMAMEASRSVREIANCNPVALYYLANHLTEESWYFLRVDFPHDGPAVKSTFTGAQLASSTEFRKRLLAIAPGALYTGSQLHLDLWMKKQMFGIQTVQTIDYIGYVKEHGAWVFDNLAVKGGRVNELNAEDFFNLGKLSIKTLNRSVRLDINPALEEYDPEWAKLLWYCFREKGIVALSFWLGALFAEQIRAKQESYPFIEVVGDPGAGKSTLIEFFWKLCGRTDYEGFDPQKATIAARARNFAQVSNLPIVLIESDRDSGDDKNKQKGFDWDELKTAYNGRSVRSTGVKNSGNDTREPPFRGALVISQNAPVSASPAFMERLMHVHFQLQPHTDASREAFQELARYPVEKVSGFILKATKAEERILQTVLEKTPDYERLLDANPALRQYRIIKNHAQLMALVDALGHVVQMHDDTRQRVHEEIVRMAEERQQAINQDHPTVQEFWEVYDYLEADDDTGISVLNHCRNDAEIAINLNHFIQVAGDRKQQLPDMAQLKKVLRTSKVRKFVDIKPVNSAIHDNYNRQRSINTPAKPSTVKCWVFQSESGKRRASDN